MIKQSCLRLLLYGLNRLNLQHRDLPHFGFRSVLLVDSQITQFHRNQGLTGSNRKVWLVMQGKVGKIGMDRVTGSPDNP